MRKGSSNPNIPLGAKRLSDEIEIWEIPNFASDQECNDLMEDAHKNGFKTSEVDDKSNPITKSRTSETSFLPQSKTNIGKTLGERAQKLIGGNELEGIQVQKYEKGQKYNPHFDSFDGVDGNQQRSWTLMIYLSDVGKGGGTFFPRLKLRAYPKKGTAIVWNNLDIDGCRQNDTLHTGEPVEEGTKYIVTYWFRKDGSKCSKKESFNMDVSLRTGKNTKNYIPKGLEPFGNSSNSWVMPLVISLVVVFGLVLLALLVCWYKGMFKGGKRIKRRR